MGPDAGISRFEIPVPLVVPAAVATVCGRKHLDEVNRSVEGGNGYPIWEIIADLLEECLVISRLVPMRLLTGHRTEVP